MTFVSSLENFLEDILIELAMILLGKIFLSVRVEAAVRTEK